MNCIYYIFILILKNYLAYVFSHLKIRVFISIIIYYICVDIQISRIYLNGEKYVIRK